jgi:chemotaxis signal transduction protein
MIDNPEPSNPSSSEPNIRRFRLFTRSNVDFAISENEIAAIEDWRAPAPLPNAPDSVLGVVGIQGRMLTVLDIARISGVNQATENTGITKGRIVALRGDEQLALVVDAEGVAIETSDEVLQTEGRELMTTINHAGSEFSVLNPQHLFLRAIQGRERRRRRF